MPDRSRRQVARDMGREMRAFLNSEVKVGWKHVVAFVALILVGMYVIQATGKQDLRDYSDHSQATATWLAYDLATATRRANVQGCLYTNKAFRLLNQRSDAQRRYLSFVIDAPSGVPQAIQDAAQDWTNALTRLKTAKCRRSYPPPPVRPSLPRPDDVPPVVGTP